jgi:hypothetical protein
MQVAPVTTATSVATNDDYQHEVLTALQTMSRYVEGVVTALVNVGALPINHLLPAPVAAPVHLNPGALYYGPGPYHSGATQFDPRIGPNQIQQPVITPQWQGAHALIPAAQTQASDPLALPLPFTFPQSTQPHGVFYPGAEAASSNMPLYAPVARAHNSAHIQGAHLQGAPYSDTFGFDQPNNTTERDGEFLQGSSSGRTQRDFTE